VSLPSGVLVARPLGPGYQGYYSLKRTFHMQITFREDPATGCVANKGEYLQEVCGFSERDHGTGVMQREPGVEVVGGPLHPTEYREDARGGSPGLPYGHRYVNDIAEFFLRPNVEEDRFLPERRNGPHYSGEDAPGMMSRLPGERFRFRFRFRGAPVNRHLGVRTRIGDWQRWDVRGDFMVPRPPTPPTPTPMVPAPYEGPSISAAPPSAAPPGPFCFNGTIGCLTLELLRARQRERVLLTEADIREAIAVEHRLLLQHRPRPAPTFDPLTGAEGEHARVAELRQEARRRVLDIAGLRALIPSQYAEAPGWTQ
jgi:hypothetical protein